MKADIQLTDIQCNELTQRFFVIEAQLSYSTTLVSGVQQQDLAFLQIIPH